MAQEVSATFATLPIELSLAIIYFLDYKDVIALRRTCRAFYDLEKAQHEIIWKDFNRQLCRKTQLFSPTFELPATRLDHELVLQRGTVTETILLETQVNRTQEVVPSYCYDLTGVPALDSPIHSVFVVPGGRYLLLINDTTLQVWDLSLHLGPEGGTAPALLKTFSIPDCTKAYASTLGGPESSTVRLLLRSPHEAPSPEMQEEYDVTESDFLDIFRVYELCFGQSEPELKGLSQLPIVRQGCSKFTLSFSKNRLLLILEELYSCVWDFVENTYAYWRQLDPEGPKFHRSYLTDDHINFVFPHRNLYISMPIPAMRSVDFGKVFRLPAYTQASAFTCLHAGESRRNAVSTILPTNNRSPHLDIPLTAIECLHPVSFWGLKPCQTFVAVTRDHHDDYVDTCWYEVSPAGFLDLPESGLLGVATHIFPTGSQARCESVRGLPDIELTSKTCGGQLVTLSVWRQDRYLNSARTVFASISSSPNIGDDFKSLNVEGVNSLFPLAKVDTPLLGMDFCALSGIMVAVSASVGEGSEGRLGHLVRVFDFAKPRLPKM